MKFLRSDQLNKAVDHCLSMLSRLWLPYPGTRQQKGSLSRSSRYVPYAGKGMETRDTLGDRRIPEADLSVVEPAAHVPGVHREAKQPIRCNTIVISSTLEGRIQGRALAMGRC